MCLLCSYNDLVKCDILHVACFMFYLEIGRKKILQTSLRSASLLALYILKQKGNRKERHREKEKCRFGGAVASGHVSVTKVTCMLCIKITLYVQDVIYKSR